MYCNLGWIVSAILTVLPTAHLLRKIFTRARITVLASPTLKRFHFTRTEYRRIHSRWHLFHKIAAGRTPVGQGRLRRIRDAGAPYKFDLAVDAHKHFDPRRADIHLRPFSGWIRIFRSVSWFGHHSRLGWRLPTTKQAQPHRRRFVDIGRRDRSHARKRSLVGDPGPPAIPLMELPENVRKLFAKPVAAIQAASRSNVRRRSFPR